MTRRALLSAVPALLAAQAPGAKLKPRRSKDIAASPISIGFETLDRQMFDPERTYDHMGALGVKWARCQTGWARTETEPGKFDFVWLDRVVDQLLARGVQPWFNLGYGNKLYIKDAPHPTAVGWAPVFNADQIQAWQRFVTRIGDHFKDRVTHWEIWNEPNIPSYWQPAKSNPDDYVKLVSLTAPLLRKAVPKAQLIGGVVAGFGGTGQLDFTERMMKAGLGRYVDKYSYHPYRARPEEHYASDFRATRAILNRYKPGMPMWQGENGAPSQPKGFGALGDGNWTEPAQAKWLLRRLLTDLSSGVEVTSYFLIVDLANYVTAKGNDGRTNFKGVLRATDYTPKPSYHALQNLCSLFDSETKPAEFDIHFDAVRNVPEKQAAVGLSFVRRNRPVYAFWYPSLLPDQEVNGTANVTVWSSEDAKLESPVLVDLRSGSITPLRADPKNGQMFADIPLVDSPYLITDASIVGL